MFQNKIQQNFKDKHLKHLTGIFFLLSIFFALTNFASANDPTALPLLQQSDLEYLGAFRVPQGKYGVLSGDTAKTFSYGGAALTYDPTRNGLILTTNSTIEKMIAEISIPSPIVSNSASNLNIATILQNPIDINNNQLSNLGKDLNYSSPSTMSLTSGSQSFILSSVLKGDASGSAGIVVGIPIKITSTANQANYMSGTVTAVSWINSQGIGGPSDNSIGDATVTVDIANVSGSGTFSDWDVSTHGSKIGNGGQFGNFLVYNNKLIGNAWAYYDAAYKAFNSHYIASLNWDTDGSGFQGFYPVGLNPILSTSPNGGFVGGYMANIPQQWQSAMGGPALTGMGAIAIISRSSLGPSVSVFDPDDLGNINPAPAKMLVGYPSGHATLGDYVDKPSLGFNRSTEVRGLVFPDGSRSVLFFGRQGLGASGQGDTCYGAGVNDPTVNHTFPGEMLEHSTDANSFATGTKIFNISSGLPVVVGASVIIKPTNNTLYHALGTITAYSGNTLTVNFADTGHMYGDGATYSDWEVHIAIAPGNASVEECYDAVDSSKGTHGYPYAYYVWAYDANDLAHVKNGDTIGEDRSVNIDSSCATGTIYQPWCVKPYDKWVLDFPLAVANAHILGAAYDPASQNLYVSQLGGNVINYDILPLIQVYHLNLNGVSDATSPAAPSGLVVN